MAGTVEKSSRKYLDFQEYVDFQVDKARSAIKWTDILTSLAGIALLGLVYLLAFAILDHWVIEGGMSKLGRALMLGGLAIVSLGWIIWRVVVPYWRKVNSLYAAWQIERSSPEMRGSLLSLVDGAGGTGGVNLGVRQAIQKRAATALTKVDVDHAIDRRRLLWLSYAVLAAVVLVCLYAVFSPKSIGNSIVRAFLPAAAVDVDTETEILKVLPGDATLAAGEPVLFEVNLGGKQPEVVSLTVTTDDRRLVDESLKLSAEDEVSRLWSRSWSGPEGLGIDVGFSYRVKAGDASAGPFRIEVVRPPSAEVETIAYDFPDYMGFEDTTRSEPEIDAYEGTEVTVTALANQPLRSARLVFADSPNFDAEGGISAVAEERSFELGSSGERLTARFPLRLRSDQSSPKYYRIECVSESGLKSRDHAVYEVRIRPDLDPEILLRDPRSDIERPANAIVPLLWAARDDFAVTSVAVRFEKNGSALPKELQLAKGAASSVGNQSQLKLENFRLEAGDELTFWLKAFDNREPKPNATNSQRVRISIIEPVSPEEVEERLEEDRRKQDELVKDRNDASDANDDRGDDPSADDDSSEGEGGESGTKQEIGKQDGPGEPGNDKNAGDSEDSNSSDTGGQDGSQSKNGSSGEQNSPSEPLANDGSADDQALRRAVEHFNELDEQKDGEDEPKDSGGTGEAGTENQSGERDPQGREEQDPEAPSNQSDEQRPDENGQKGEDAQGGQNSDGGMPKPGDGSEGDGGNATDGAPDAGEASDEGAGSGESTGPGDGEADPQAGRGKNERPGSDEGDAAQSEDGTDSGEQTPASDDGNAESRPADGSEKGPARGSDERDPNAAKADGPLEREGPKGATEQRTPDEGERPENSRSEEGPPPEGARPDRGSSDDGGQSDPSANEGNGNSDVDRESPNNAEDNGTQQSTRDAPAGADEPAGSGQPDGQKSDQPDGGEAGGSQEASEGNRGPDGTGTAETTDQQDPNGTPGESGSPEESDPSMTPKDGSEKSQSESSAGDESGESSESGGSSEKSKSDGESQGSGSSGESSSESSSSAGESGKGQGSGSSSDGSSSSSGEAGSSSSESGSSEGGGGTGGQSSSDDQNSAKDSAGAGGGTAAGESSSEGGTGGGSSGGEEADLDYAKQATDLVLKRLEEDLERGEPDPELLEKLGWGDDDLKRFSQRLRDRLSQKKPETAREQAKSREFDEMLKSIDFDNPIPEVRNRQIDSSPQGGSAGRRTKAPPEYRDLYDAFTRSIAGKNGLPGEE
ncbi:hypothetical protein [Stratiformator vulcanicus]|uniref:Uncharacterized protein n=1 Tax=Stratiformator vulcanicus TaxID=2527980 RepID=A0A517R2H0_9PLAN|nr:hypothetical protein [Stratiformator vulcanicus]QDT38058.1 hypothetical protein Pan189_24430 [Stratiformator vulcanicus]